MQMADYVNGEQFWPKCALLTHAIELALKPTEAGGTLENAQAMAAHESPRTTKLYRTGAEITLDEVERIAACQSNGRSSARSPTSGSATAA